MLTKTLHIPLIKTMGDKGVILGYGSVFGVRDDQGDIVPRGAFTASLRAAKKQKRLPPMLWQHDPKRPCGIWLKVEEDAVGLLVRGQMNLHTQLGREAYQLVKQGAVTGLSIGYRIAHSRFDAAKRARVLDAIILDEVSLVSLPANRAARVRAVKHTKAFGLKYSPDQPRDDIGRWSNGSGAVSSVGPTGGAYTRIEKPRSINPASAISSIDAPENYTRAPTNSRDPGAVLLTRSDGSIVRDPRTMKPVLMPSTVSLSENVRRGNELRQLDYYNRSMAVRNLMATNQSMDYQRIYNDAGNATPRYRDFGNYNYGAVMAAAGYSRAEAYAFAGGYNVYQGRPDRSGRYLTNHSEHAFIRMGYNDYITDKIK